MRLRLLLRSLFFLSLFASTIACAQNWRPLLPTPSNGGYAAASFFFDEMRGFVGFNGTNNPAVIRTTNGGTTWTGVIFSPPLTSGPVHPVKDIWFRDSLTGWLVLWSQTGSDPCLWHSTDGGATWKGMPGLSSMHYPASVRQTPFELLVTEHPIQGSNGNIIGGGIWNSTDSGLTWNYRSGIRNLGLSFLNNSIGISTAYRSQFLYTNDGGQSWSSSSAPNNFVHEAWSAYSWKQEGIFIAVPEDTASTLSYVYRTRHFSSGFLWDRMPTQLPFKTNGHVAGVNQVIYVQKYGTIGTAADGLYRSMDTGNTWIPVGGPASVISQDVRFSVTGCGDVVYAFDDNGQIWKTNNGGGGPPIPQCVFINKDSLGTLTAGVCDSAHARYWFHNTNYQGVIINDIRIIDTVRKPWRSGSVYYDSLPAPDAAIEVGDSVMIDLGWTPRMLLDSTGGDSAKLRVIFSVPYLNYRLDTIFLPLKLKAFSSPAMYTLSTQGLAADSVSPCVPFDTTISIVNHGCDSLTLTGLQLAFQSPWVATDSSGNPLKMPVKLAPNEGAKYHLTASPNGTKAVTDSLKVKTHYQGHDSTTAVYLQVTGKYLQALQPTLAAMQFDSVATCVSYDSLVSITNGACTEIQITSADLTGTDWTIVDTAGKAIAYPIHVPPGTHGILRLRFAPKLTGIKQSKLTLHVLNGATNSTTTMQLDGLGVDNGTFAYLRKFDIGSITVCDTGYTTITFRNTTCNAISLRDARSHSNFVVTDSGSLPVDVPKGGAITLHVRFLPNGTGAQQGWIEVFYEQNGVPVGDSILVTAFAGPGSSTFGTVPAFAKLAFDARTECDQDSSASWTLSNSSICGATSITEVSLDGNLSPTFTATTDKQLPASITPGNDLKVTLAIAQLVSGNYTGNMHVKFMLGDGSMHDTTIAVTLQVTPGPHTLVMDATPVDFGNVAGCAGFDTVLWIEDQGCAGLLVNSLSITGSGFSYLDTVKYVLSGKKLPIHIHYDGSGSGAVSGQLTITTNSDGANPNRTIDLTANVQPFESVNFLLKVTKMPVKKRDFFNVELYPDRDVSINGLNSISGVLEFYEDNFQMNVNPSVMSGTTLSTWTTARTGKVRDCQFAVTSSQSIVLDHTKPILSLQLQEVVADSSSSTMQVKSLAMAGSTPNFGDCMQANTTAYATTTFTPDCGDSIVIEDLRGDIILLIAPPNPNPLTSQNGGKLHFGMRPTVDGDAYIELFDALGRSRATLLQHLSPGTSEATLDLSKIEAGSYYYSIRFESTAGVGQQRGSIVVLK